MFYNEIAKVEKWQKYFKVIFYNAHRIFEVHLDTFNTHSIFSNEHILVSELSVVGEARLSILLSMREAGLGRRWNMSSDEQTRCINCRFRWRRYPKKSACNYNELDPQRYAANTNGQPVVWRTVRVGNYEHFSNPITNHVSVHWWSCCQFNAFRKLGNSSNTCFRAPKWATK